MNSSDPTRPCSSEPDERTLEELLHDVRLRFYATQPPAAFHRDRRRLLSALTWPALWLERRGLFCSSQRYRQIVIDRLDAIRAHGNHAQYGRYFPTYLLKCLQDFLDRHGDELHGELKHVRNALDVVCGSLRFAERALVQSRQIDAMAQVHRFLRATAPAPSDPNQTTLF
jgi:hypothetical protein